MSNPLFLPYQTELMRSVRDHPVTIIEKSRRTGVSWAASFIADLTAAAGPQHGGMDVFYLGYNLEMAREFIDYCADHARIMQTVAHKVKESFWKDPDREEKDVKIFRIDFASGHKILALPSRPRALRGMQGLVIIDEAAFHDALEELLKAAMALLMWGGKVLVISTHNGEQNPFNRLVNDVRSARRPGHVLRLTLDDALSDGLYRRICARQNRPWSARAQRLWREELIATYGTDADEELFCIPATTGGAWLPPGLIEARCTPDIPVIRWGCEDGFVLLSEQVRLAETAHFLRTELTAPLGKMEAATPHLFGVDFGRSGDLTVLWVLALEADMTRRTALVVELRNVPFEQQKQILHFVLDRLPRLRAGAMDGRGNGHYLAEVTIQKYGPRIEAVMLSEGWYRTTMPALKAAFEDGRITLPCDRDIIDDLRTLTLVQGVARIPDQRRQGTTGPRHGDAAMALALAYAASRSETRSYDYIPVPLSRPAHAAPSGFTARDEEERDRTRSTAPWKSGGQSRWQNEMMM